MPLDERVDQLRPLVGGRAAELEGVPVDDTGDEEKDVLTTSQRCLDECAKVIRDKPEHWMWTYKRWKRRPTPDAAGFPFYSKYAKTE